MFGTSFHIPSGILSGITSDNSCCHAIWHLFWNSFWHTWLLSTVSSHIHCGMLSHPGACDPRTRRRRGVADIESNNPEPGTCRWRNNTNKVKAHGSTGSTVPVCYGVYSKGMVTRHEVPKVQIMLELKWSRGMMFGWSREAKVKTTATQKLNSDLFWDDKSVISVMTLSFRPSRALRASRAQALRAHRGP